MKHFFLDTNVILDALARRQPFAADAIQLFEAAAQRKVILYVTSLSFSNIHYILRRSIALERTVELLTELAQQVQIVAVDARAVQQALTASFPDFEDALQYFAATTIPDLDAIITRDPKGFRAGTLPVLAPAEAAARLA